MAKAKLGSGARFKAVEAAVARSGARDPAAVAAAIGRKKYGAKKMAELSARGRRDSRPGSHGHKLVGGQYRKGQ